jgi:hypothetical protein
MLRSKTWLLAAVMVIVPLGSRAAPAPASGPAWDLATIPGATADWWTEARQNLEREEDGENAANPLAVDPISGSPSWTFESNFDGAELGFSVATAGDVNGDGFSDVIVGAPKLDNPQTDEGRAYVFHGSAGGLSTIPAWTAEGNQTGGAGDGALFGISVACAGDVNGDDYADVIIGASGYDNGQTDEGQAYVYYGSVNGLGASPAWTVESNQAWAYLGHSVATAGDVNGDGFSDVIVGVIYYDSPEMDEGRAYAYYGSSVGLSMTANWTGESNQAGEAFGSWVATAGDVNGDGYADVIVGAPKWDIAPQHGQEDAGRAFVYHGSPTGLGASAWNKASTQPGALFGGSVATAGDVNGDGYSDVVVGAEGFDIAGYPDLGAVVVYQGTDTGLQSSGTSLVIPGFLRKSDAHFGSSVATAGDVNGDGYADVIVGARLHGDDPVAAGLAMVSLGSASGLSDLPAWYASGPNQARAYFGTSVATAGDVNGDGYSDLIVGGPNFDNPQIDEGQAFVFHGSGAGLSVTYWAAERNRADDRLGISSAIAGDVNGDGYSDFIVGAPNYDNGETEEGCAYVHYGSAEGPVFVPWQAEGNQIGAQFGWSVSTAGDVNGDGFSDVIVGAPGDGRAYVFHGSQTGLAELPAWMNEWGASQRFGWSVATAGDVNGDGFSDVIVGAPNAGADGRVFVYQGSQNGLAATPAWTADGSQPGSSFGYSVATAGDVNGDGFSEVIIGAFYPLTGGGPAGAFVYEGSDTGLGASPAWAVEVSEDSPGFGKSVATAGDINGDGFSDVIVGANYFDNGEDLEGRAFVYYGSENGLASSAGWTAEGNQAVAHFGASVSTAGDVNGDGFSDVIIGAPSYNGGESYEGRAFVYHGSETGLDASPSWTAESNYPGARFGWSVATAGDVTGDGFSDVIAGAPEMHGGNEPGEGWAYIYYGNGGNGLDRIPRQTRVLDAGTPVAVLGLSDVEGRIRIEALARTPMGRGIVRLEWEVEPLSTPLDGSDIQHSDNFDTGAPGPNGSARTIGNRPGDLEPGTLYHWRLRIATDSPFFPHSRWFSIADNAPSEADIRTALAGTTAVEETSAGPARVGLIERNVPNPFTSGTEIAYTLPSAARHRLAVYDVLGRQVVLLTEGVQPAGRHRRYWDGRDGQGHRLPAGIYFLRLDLAGRVESRKMVLTQ